MTTPYNPADHVSCLQHIDALAARIDELERLYEGMIQEAVKANAKTAEVLARNAQLAEDNLRLALAKKAATDRVVELESAAERAARVNVDLKEELQHVLDDWNALVKASGSPTNGAAIGHVTRLRADVGALRAAAQHVVEVDSGDGTLAKRGDGIPELTQALAAMTTRTKPNRHARKRQWRKVVDAALDALLLAAASATVEERDRHLDVVRAHSVQMDRMIDAWGER